MSQMDQSKLPSIDVVIPVYNAPVSTQNCINSVVACLGQSIKHILIQDDASDVETRDMLNQLPYKCVRIHHAKKNQGFGKSVNEAVCRSNADYVLVLNSDTVASEDFLPPLCVALAVDPQLAAIIPSGNYYKKFNLNQYSCQPGGYILTHRLGGYAFLIRRSVFQEMCGFDPAYGRGYYEDVDMGRRLIKRGWRIGMHPGAYIYHKGGGSFGRGLSYQTLKRRGRITYFSRYPKARRNVMLISGNCPLTDFPLDFLDAIDNVFREGGGVHWLTPEHSPQLFCLHMTHTTRSLSATIRLLLRGLLRKDKRVSEVWILPNASHLQRSLFFFLGQLRGIKVRS